MLFMDIEKLNESPEQELRRLKKKKEDILSGLGGRDFIPGGDPVIIKLSDRIAELEEKLKPKSVERLSEVPPQQPEKTPETIEMEKQLKALEKRLRG